MKLNTALNGHMSSSSLSHNGAFMTRSKIPLTWFSYRMLGVFII